MKKKFIIKKNEEFSYIIQKQKPFRMKYFNIFLLPTSNDYCRFGITVSKKIGNAVTRNKIKRRIKNILREKNYQKKTDCIIMVKKGILDLTYQEIEKNLFFALKTTKMIVEDINEKV